MKRSIFVRLFFIINLLLALLLSLRAVKAVSATVPRREALTFYKRAMRTFIEDNRVNRSPAQIHQDLTLARHVLKQHSDETGHVSLTVVAQLLHAYQQWLRINYPENFHSLLAPMTPTRPLPVRSGQPARVPVPSRASRR